ncbi:MAG: Bug family tripartite tricarboxylate transporter substrate binding protein [Xanthobacteraceae bacterium]
MKAIGVAAVLSALVTAGNAFAQESYPDKPLRILVGFVAGGPADIIARVVGDKLTEAWGKPVVIENVTGSGGNMATERVAKSAPPDGYTLLLGTSGPFVIHPSLYPKLPFDPVKDFAPITQLCFTANVLVVNNDVPAKSVAELTALARAQPDKLTFGSAGVGTTQHLSGEMYKTMASLDIQHVPYRGIAAVMPDLLGGRLTMVFASPASALPLAREGKVRPLAVTSLTRAPSSPDLPTMVEAGFPGFDAIAWFALLAPVGTPDAIIAKLHREAVRILALPDVRKRFDDLGMVPMGTSPAQFAAAMAVEAPLWAKVIKASGAKLVD